MPGFNQTGPMGQGPMTGRGRGSCANPRAAYGFGYGRGMGIRRGAGFGRGYGRGFGRSYFAEDLPYQASDPNIQTAGIPAEIDRLQAQAQSMQRSLDAINERLTEMEKNK